MKKRTSKRILSLALSFFLILSLCPTSAFATDAADGQSSGQETQTMTSSGNADGEENKAQNGNGNSQSTNDSILGKGSQEDQIDPQSADDTMSKSPIQSIIGKDDQSNDKFYTTLLDSKDRIIDTTDPELEKDSYYKSKDEGGQAGTVDLDAQLKVRFRMAEIIENSGESGVQENVLYYMTLPSELVPVKQDSSGKVLVDPESPLTFFQSSDLQCFGGIYTEGSSYQLQMYFKNVVDQLNIAGAFQYDVTLASTVEAGKECVVSYVPGGTLRFNVTPKKEEPAEADESLSITGEQDSASTDKINWTLTLTDKDMKLDAKRLTVTLDGSGILADNSKDSEQDICGLSSIEITYEDGSSETLNTTRMNTSAYSFYRRKCGFNPTYTDNGTSGILGSIYTDATSETTTLMSAYVNWKEGTKQYLTNTLYIDMAALKSNSTGQGNNAGSDKPDSIDQKISKYVFHFSSQVYNNYNISGANYTANVTMTDADGESNKVTASDDVGIYFGNLRSGSLTDTLSKDTGCLGIPTSVETSYSVSNTDYRGKYFSLEFMPQQNTNGKYTNTTNAIFYSNANGFWIGGNGNLVGNSDSSFSNLKIGGVSSWTFCAPVSKSDIDNAGNNGLLKYYVKGTDTNYLVTLYQIQKVFENMGANDTLLLYRSSSTVNGEYICILVDPQTQADAYYSNSQGWKRLAKKSSDNSDAKAANWKIHVFNAPAQNVSLNFTQSNGTAYGSNQVTTGSAMDTMKVSNQVYGQSGNECTTYWGYSIEQPAATEMTGSWVKDDTIFWEFTVDTKNIKSWRSSTVYINVPKGQELCIGQGILDSDAMVTLDGVQADIRYLSCYKDSVWAEYTKSASTYSGTTGSPLTTDSSAPSITKVAGSDTLYQISVGPLTSYADSDGKVKIGFATRLAGPSAVDSAAELTCQAELVTENGETTAFGNTGYSRYPFKASAQGSIGSANITKTHESSGHAEADEDGVSHITDDWKVSAVLPEGTDQAGYSGVWSLHDDMADAYAEDEEGHKVSGVVLADHISLTGMKVSLGTEESLFDLSAEDLEELAAAGSKDYISKDGGITLSISYSGNMKSGFDLELSGLKDVTALSVTYTTDFNQKSFFEALEKSKVDTLNHFFTTVLTNNAHRGGSTDTQYPKQSEEVKHRVTASIAMNKSVEKAQKEEHLIDAQTVADYSIDTQIGYSPTNYVETEDFLLGYSDNSKEYGETDSKAMEALADALQLTNLKITATDVDGVEKEIYSGGEENGSWKKNESDSDWNVNFDYKPDSDHPGSLFKVKITKNGEQIGADYKFTISYKLNICMDKEDGTDFRDSGYYHGGELKIKNGGESTRTVKKAAEGRSRVRSLLNIVGLGDDSQTLTVDCGAGVAASYLADKVIDKKLLSSGSDSQSWMAYEWTGTKGKNDITGSVTDELKYKIDQFTYIDEDGYEMKLDDLGPAHKEEVISKVKNALYQNTSFKNIKLYYTEANPTDTPNGINKEDLLYSYDKSFKALKEPETVYDEKVQSKDKKDHQVTLITGLGKNGEPVGFTASADNLNCDSYFVATYETEIDWNSVYETLEEYGYSQPSLQVSYSNVAKDGGNSSKEESGSYTELEDESLEKKLTKSDAENGGNSWQIKAYTGPNKSDSLTLSDELKVTVDDERIQEAAEAALSIERDSIVIKAGDKTVYEKGKAVAGSGWTNENVEIKVDGRKLDLTIKNTDNSKVIAINTTYTVEYNTVLDKDAYLANGGQNGDEAKLENAVSAKHGNFENSSTDTAEFKPNIPVSADKKSLGNGSDGKDQTTSLWETSAKTGEAGRKNFTLSDSISLVKTDESQTEEQIELIEKALKLQDLVIKVKTGDGEETTYTKDTLPEGVTLTENGAGYTLVFAELPKNTTVSLTYAVHFDQDAYMAAGGEGNVSADLKNSFKVSAADGSSAAKEAEGHIEHSEGFVKAGTVSKEKSEDGNPLINWSIDVNLFDLYTAEQIKGLKEVTVTDELSSILSLTEGSVKLLTEDGEEIPQDKYTVEEKGNVLKVTVTNPAAYPIFKLTFETECGTSVSGLVNEASLSVDGKQIKETESEDVGKLNAANQWGWIQSMKVPEFTPVAYKYLDSELCTEKGLFSFSIVQVDESGDAIENGYQDTATNDENGKITFKKITYREKPIEGSYYYQIRETSKAEPYTYTIDERVFTIRVDVIANAAKGKFIVSYKVLDPENYDEVRFDNTTVKTRDFTVTKKWNDKDDKEGVRPKSITVYLLNNGKRYNNMSVTLNEENNWTYTWKDLPIANGNYSVEEAEVEGYTAKVDTENWSSVITNTYTGKKPKDEEDTPKGDKDKPKTDKPTTEQPTTEQPTKDKPTKDKPAKVTPNGNSGQSNTSQQKNTSKKTKGVRTGDIASERMTVWMLLMMLAILAGAEVVKKKKH